MRQTFEAFCMRPGADSHKQKLNHRMHPGATHAHVRAHVLPTSSSRQFLELFSSRLDANSHQRLPCFMMDASMSGASISTLCLAHLIGHCSARYKYCTPLLLPSGIMYIFVCAVSCA